MEQILNHLNSYQSPESTPPKPGCLVRVWHLLRRAHVALALLDGGLVHSSSTLNLEVTSKKLPQKPSLWNRLSLLYLNYL